MPTQTISLPDEVAESVHSRVASGLYRDEQEVLKAAIRSLEREEDEHGARLTALRAAIQEGLDSGVCEGTTEELFDSLRQELQIPKRQRPC